MKSSDYSSFGTLLLVLFFLLFIQCRNGESMKSCTISGSLKGITGHLYLYEQGTTGIHIIDSVIPDREGTFTLRFEPSETGFFFLKTISDNPLVFICSPGEQFLVRGNAVWFPDSVVIEGNRETELLRDFYQYSRINQKHIDSLQALLDQHKEDSSFYILTVSLEPVFQDIWNSQRRYEQQFIREHAGTLASLLVVNYHFGVRPVLSPKSDYSDYKLVDSGLQVTYPENRHTLFFRQWLHGIR